MGERIIRIAKKLSVGMLLAAVMTMMFALPVFAGGAGGMWLRIEYVDASTEFTNFDIKTLDPEKKLPVDVYIDNNKFKSEVVPLDQYGHCNEYFVMYGLETASVSANSLVSFSIPVPEGYSYVTRKLYTKYYEGEGFYADTAARIWVSKNIADLITTDHVARWNPENETVGFRMSDCGLPALDEYLSSENEDTLDVRMQVFLLKDGDTAYDPSKPSDPTNPEAPVIADTRFSSPQKQSDGSYAYDVITPQGSTFTADEFKKAAGDRTYKIKSSKSSVATMTSKGKFVVKKSGEAVITLTQDGKKYIFNIKSVLPKFPVKKLYLNAGSVSGDATNKEYLAFTTSGLRDSATYTSSNTAVVSVDGEGNVEALAKGKATITATVYGKKYKCTVYVYDPALNGKDAVKVNKKIKLTVKKGCGKTTDWRSSDESIATVTSKGVVKGVSAGEVTIFCKNNGRLLKKTITVNEN